MLVLQPVKRSRDLSRGSDGLECPAAAIDHECYAGMGHPRQDLRGNLGHSTQQSVRIEITELLTLKAARQPR